MMCKRSFFVSCLFPMGGVVEVVEGAVVASEQLRGVAAA